MQVLLPIAGQNSYFPIEDFPFPKPLIEIGGRPMISWVVESMKTLGTNINFVFISLEDEATKYSYDQVFRLVTRQNCQVIKLKKATAGSLCSCLMAVDSILDGEPLLIANSDQVIDCSLSELREKFEDLQADAGVVTFPSVHPRWSYVKTEDGVNVVEASEKRVISRRAIAGLYYFKRGADFIRAAKKTIQSRDHHGGIYYVAPSLNQLILEGLKVVAVDIAEDEYHSLYLPSQVDSFERLLAVKAVSETHIKASRAPSPPALSLNLVIPAAGHGSRFAQAGYVVPKPFIDVRGKPMIQHVLDNLSVSEARTTVLLRRSHMTAHPAAHLGLAVRCSHVVPVDDMTEGTVCTVLLAREYFDNEAPLLIANSDQLVDFSCELFVRDAVARGLDGSILVFREASGDPKWSYAQIDDNGLVVRVAEKDPISDLATVGIYYFAKGSDFVRAALDMIVRNQRVNNEFYTCPVYNHMIRLKLKIGVYEVQSASMHGLGTPQDLEAFLGRPQ